MICWSCRREIPATAKFCPHCEAKVEVEPAVDEQVAIQDVLADISPAVINEFRDILETSKTGEEFVNRVMVGDCPKCGGSNTQDCENHPEIGPAYYARCLECDYLWCIFCGETINPDRPLDHECPDWSEIDLGDEDWDDADLSD